MILAGDGGKAFGAKEQYFYQEVVETKTELKSELKSEYGTYIDVKLNSK